MGILAKARRKNAKKRVRNIHENAISKEIVDAAFKIHTRLGPGVLESVYEVTLAYELKQRGLHVVRQLPVPLIYEGICFEEGYRLDLVVEDKVIVEVKSIDAVLPSTRNKC